MQLLSAEKVLSQELRVVQNARVSFLCQKSKVHWHKDGDQNTKLFHQSIKMRHYQNNIHSIKDANGTMVDSPDEVTNAFVEYYVGLFGTDNNYRIPVNCELVKRGNVLNDTQRASLCTPFTTGDIKNALWLIDGNKAPGHDGYSCQFFKDAWEIVGDDICRAVGDFFTTGRLLQQVNTTILTLIPKSDNPLSVTEFRPIGCCSVVYKCISKLLCMLLKNVLGDIVDEAQSAFIEGRQILQNVILVQELMNHYKRRGISPKCVMKIDLRKAYDSVVWPFVEEMLNALNFPPQFTKWVMTCITNTKYSLNINGGIYGCFSGKKGLRQGDPFSPLIF